MKNIASSFIAIVIIGLLVAMYMMAFVVKQTEQAMVLRLSAVNRVIVEPGLYFKMPFIENVVYFDKRILDFDATNKLEIITSDNNRLVVDAFMRYRITEPLTYYRSVKTKGRAHLRLEASLDGALRRVLGKASRNDIVQKDREKLMHDIRTIVNQESSKLGIFIDDVRIKRADLPEANSQAVFNRMQTDRKEIAAKFRAEGKKNATKLRAMAERESTIIRAEATRDGEVMRGQGDAKRNAIFAKAYSKDAEFFAFYRSMQAYEKGLANSDTRMLLSPDSKFFEYFNK